MKDLGRLTREGKRIVLRQTLNGISESTIPISVSSPKVDEQLVSGLNQGISNVMGGADHAEEIPRNDMMGMTSILIQSQSAHLMIRAMPSTCRNPCLQVVSSSGLDRALAKGFRRIIACHMLRPSIHDSPRVLFHAVSEHPGRSESLSIFSDHVCSLA